MSRLNKFAAFAGMSSLLLVGSADAALTVVADYTFDDPNALLPFTITGSPIVVGGQLGLDGGSYLEIVDPLGGATADYVVEAIVTAESFDAFDFLFARNDPAGAGSGNNGQGAILFANAPFSPPLPGRIQALNSNSGFAPSDTALVPGAPAAVAIVQDGAVTELYINGTLSASTNVPIVGTPTNLGIGTHPFDGVAGGFNGSIDRVRLSTFTTGQFDEADLLPVPEPTSLVPVALGGLALVRRRR